MNNRYVGLAGFRVAGAWRHNTRRRRGSLAMYTNVTKRLAVMLLSMRDQPDIRMAAHSLQLPPQELRSGVRVVEHLLGVRLFDRQRGRGSQNQWIRITNDMTEAAWARIRDAAL